MSFKINKNKLEAYSQALTEKISNEFYSNKKFISGKEILNLTPVIQVNVFIIFIVFERWKEETGKLKSPFFDYEDQDVKEALARFMNTISEHIRIEKEFMKPLLHRSILETLTWVFFPEDYIQSQYQSGRLTNLDKVKEFQKYIRINSILISELISKLERERKQEFSEEVLQFYFSQVHLFYKTYMEDPATILDQFSVILSFDINDLLPASQQKRKEVPAPEPVQSNPEFIIEEAYPEAEEEEKTVTEDYDGPVNPANSKKEEELISVPNVKAEDQSTEPKILNQGFSKSQLTLNDMLMQTDNSLNKRLAKSRVNEVRSAISLNKRFEFINELFKGETSDYNAALAEIDGSQNYEAAVKLLNEKYGKKFNWTIGNPSLDEFYEIIERKFL